VPNITESRSLLNWLYLLGPQGPPDILINGTGLTTLASWHVVF